MRAILGLCAEKRFLVKKMLDLHINLVGKVKEKRLISDNERRILMTKEKLFTYIVDFPILSKNNATKLS